MNMRYARLMRLVITLVTLCLMLAPAALASQDVRTVRLIDQRGDGLTLNALRGRPVLVTFVATRCTDACPIATSLFGKVRERLHHDHVPATLLEVTLDPKNDSPFVMAQYARTYQASSDSDWRFASGSRTAVETWMRAFDIVTTVGKNGIPEEHSSFVYVIDKRGRLAGTLLLSTNLVDQAERDIRQAST